MTSLEDTPNLKPVGYNIYTATVLVRNPGGDFGGYKSRFFISPVESYCGFCRQTPREPHRVACGHIFCHDCLFTNIVNLRLPCNQCHTPVRRDDCVLDIQLSRRIADSSISCPFSENCKWAGYLSRLSLHFSECTHVNPMIRSCIQSIQSHISDIAEESERLERRVDRLSELVRKMDCRCESATCEYDKQLSWIGNQMNYFHQHVLNYSPKKEPTYQGYEPHFKMPTLGQNYPSLNIPVDEMSDSLKFDLGRVQQHLPPRDEEIVQTTPKRNYKPSVYEDHVRKDGGDSDFELDLLDDIDAFPHDEFGHPLPIPPVYPEVEFKMCLHCQHFNVPTLKRCESCARII
ncbi:E3 ubiquitin-protein ligase NRDP1-like [Oopsacas minuta]|uniref:E3 ubiquitin-protein ligase NRDP1-like n=1 Tax=Oopsacas minuta TaxID=111878 RepID=A0AAV7KFV4_9METZ|nr:E3 ubiquitin-protein ligase NRDP1-like [Oopsacas minuta]